MSHSMPIRSEREICEEKNKREKYGCYEYLISGSTTLYSMHACVLTLNSEEVVHPEMPCSLDFNAFMYQLFFWFFLLIKCK